MAGQFQIEIGPNGTEENPADNKINVSLVVEEGTIRLEIPAPGALSHIESRKKYLRSVAETALAKLQEAIASELA